MAEKKQSSAGHLQLVSSNGEMSQSALKEVRIRELKMQLSYDRLMELVLEMNPIFPDNDEKFWEALKELGSNGSLYSLSVVEIGNALAKLANEKVELRELFYDSYGVTRREAILSGKYAGRETDGQIWTPGEGYRHLLFCILIQEPAHPIYIGKYLHDVLISLEICRHRESLRSSDVTQELIDTVIERWRKDSEDSNFYVRMIEGSGSKISNEEAEALRQKEHKEQLHRALYGGDFPPKFKKRP